ncbi:MAG: hypothetical protein LC734_01930 [Acidobacteria bacterium]|nr:hypothetical protein [Acidobacteriota bacterium]
MNKHPFILCTAMRLGNGKWESTVFNNRLQPTQIALGASAGSTNLLKLDYEYGTSNAVGPAFLAILGRLKKSVEFWDARRRGLV